MKKILSSLPFIALLLLAAAGLRADGSPWSVRLRATYLEPVNKSNAFTALSINFPSNAVSVNHKLIPEIDVDYAFTPSFAAELVLTIPQTQDVTLAGVGKLGTFKHLPPTFLLEYRANAGGSVRPYVGAGVNFTLLWGDRLAVAGVPLHLDHYSVGLAAQAGLDWTLTHDWSFNVDVKRAAIRSNVYAGSATLTEARLDPWLYSAGLSYQF